MPPQMRILFMRRHFFENVLDIFSFMVRMHRFVWFWNGGEVPWQKWAKPQRQPRKRPLWTSTYRSAVASLCRQRKWWPRPARYAAWCGCAISAGKSKPSKAIFQTHGRWKGGDCSPPFAFCARSLLAYLLFRFNCLFQIAIKHFLLNSHLRKDIDAAA